MTKRKAKAKRKVNSRKKTTAKAKAVSNVKKAKAKAVKSKAKKAAIAYAKRSKGKITVKGVKCASGVGRGFRSGNVKNAEEFTKLCIATNDEILTGDKAHEWAGHGKATIREYVIAVFNLMLDRFPINKHKRIDFSSRKYDKNLNVATCEALAYFEPIVKSLKQSKQFPKCLEQAISDAKAITESKQTQKQIKETLAMPKNKAKEVVKNLNRTVGGVVINQKGAIKELETTCGSIYMEYCRVNGAQSYIASKAEKEVQAEIKKVNTKLQVTLAKLKKMKSKVKKAA